jgi:translation initiation factor 4E
VSAFPQTPLPQTPGAAAVAQGWMEDIKRVITFDSVEEFWGLYNNIVPPSQLPQKANYYLFKVSRMATSALCFEGSISLNE